ncbi:MAG: hypothetical protein IAE80_09415 [Anaerolinea sp.]|nr:hypothetical protein [Anaerolinea sp.]
MRIPMWLTVIAAVIVVAVVIVIGVVLTAPDQPLITAAAFSADAITPNADGSDDIAVFSYSLTANARVSLTLTGEDGTAFAFRADEPRTPGDYRVEFSGVVDGFILAGEDFGDQQILQRLIPDGAYTWRLSAVAESGESAEQTGTLTIQDGDAPLPLLTEFTVFPQTFTPNQDGIADRSQINVFLTKDATLTAYLITPEGERLYMSERFEDSRPGEAGRHLFDYEGGVDLGANPPPDGTYPMIVHAQDAVGQRVQRESALTIQTGGKPLAQIIPQPVGMSVIFEIQPYNAAYMTTRFQAGELASPPTDPQAVDMTRLSIPFGDLLVFKLTVENYSNVPIRTTGPEPGTVYQWEQRAQSLGWNDEAGAWRVGIECQTSGSSYPWRWAVGTPDQLTSVEDPVSGNTYTYLLPGQTSVVWGAVRMNRVENLNPQTCWAGLIHEYVEISERNRVVGPRDVYVVPPGS